MTRHNGSFPGPGVFVDNKRFVPKDQYDRVKAKLRSLELDLQRAARSKYQLQEENALLKQIWTIAGK